MFLKIKLATLTKMILHYFVTTTKQVVLSKKNDLKIQFNFILRKKTTECSTKFYKNYLKKIEFASF